MSETARQKNWETRKLGDVASVTLGGTPSTLVPRYWGGEIPWMASGEVHRRYVFDVDGRITDIGLASSNATLVDPPAVALALAGQGRTRGTVARVYIRLCSNQSVALIKGVEGKLDTSYLFHNLDARYEELRARSSGGGRGGLSGAIIRAIPIAVPDFLEQHLIARILDTLDASIQAAEQIVAKLKLVKQGLLRDLLTRGIDDNGKLRDPDRHPEQFQDSPLGRIPKSWRLTSLISCLSGRPTNGLYKPASEIGSGTLIVGQTSFTDDHKIDWSATRRATVTSAERSHFGLAEEDLLVSRVFATVAGVGIPVQVARVPEAAVFESNMMRLRVNSNLIKPSFMLHSLLSNSTRKRVMGRANASNQASINQQALSAVQIALPPLVEQDLILEILDGLERRLLREEQSALKLRLLKQALMDDLLTGRVRVTPRLEGNS